MNKKLFITGALLLSISLSSNAIPMPIIANEGSTTGIENADPDNILLSIDAENGAELSELINTKIAQKTAEGKKIANISVNLAAGGNYTIVQSIETNKSIRITGDEKAPATIDASALTTPLIKLGTPEGDSDDNGFYPIGYISFNNIKVNGLSNSLFYANKQKYLIKAVFLRNSVVNINGGSKTIFDTNGGGVVEELGIELSTIYANPKNTGALYSSQSGQKATEAGLEEQKITIAGSTLYNIAYNKNVNNHRQANQKWLTYNISNNIIIDCGKDGQFIRGLNGGQSGKNPTWNVHDNSFLRTTDEGLVDHSNMESTGDSEEPVKENIADYTTFKDIENGDFTITDAGSLQAKMQIGDPRWWTDYDITKAHPVTINITPATGSDLAKALNEARGYFDNITSTKIQLEKNGEYTISEPLITGNVMTISGDNGNPATIDASANTGAFITLSETPNETLKGATGKGDYYNIQGYIDLRNLNVTGVKGNFIYDNNKKYCVESLTIDSCTVNLASSSETNVSSNAVIYFKSGYANTISVSNSTFWNNGNSDAKYFVQYNNSGRADRAGYQYQYVIFQNNTFYNIAKAGQWANYSGFSGQKYSNFIITDNIFADCGNKQIARRILGGRAASNYPTGQVTFNNNTYITYTTNEEGELVPEFESKDGVIDPYDISGTAIEDNPLFKDAANGDFTLGESTKQAKQKTGAPRWLVDYVDPGTSGINEINTNKDASNAWYNINGMRITKPSQKGIYINNGKKVVLN